MGRWNISAIRLLEQARVHTLGPPSFAHARRSPAPDHRECCRVRLAQRRPAAMHAAAPRCAKRRRPPKKNATLRRKAPFSCPSLEARAHPRKWAVRGLALHQETRRGILMVRERFPRQVRSLDFQGMIRASGNASERQILSPRPTSSSCGSSDGRHDIGQHGATWSRNRNREASHVQSSLRGKPRLSRHR
jgi:hypothetical protein